MFPVRVERSDDQKYLCVRTKKCDVSLLSSSVKAKPIVLLVSYYLSLHKLPNVWLMWSCLDDMDWHFGAHVIFKPFLLFFKPVLYEKFAQLP